MGEFRRKYFISFFPDFTIIGKQKLGSSIRGPTKLVDIKAPDLSLSRDKPLTRSITLSASQGVASARVDPGTRVTREAPRSPRTHPDLELCL